jgi:hypothetical protein
VVVYPDQGRRELMERACAGCLVPLAMKHAGEGAEADGGSGPE